MKKIILIALLISSQISFGTEIFFLNLAKNEKLEGSFSIKNSKSETTHFLFIKNSDSKKYIIKPYYLNTNKIVKELENVILDYKPNIIANFTYNNSQTITLYDENSKKLSILEFDLNTGKANSSEVNKFQKPDVIFSQNNKILFIKFLDSGKKLSLDIITNGLNLSNRIYIPSEQVYKDFKSLTRNIPDAINQNEYVENGSIKDERVYIDDSYLYFTKENNNKTTTVITFDLNDTKNITSKNFDFELGKDSKDHNTYLYNRNLISVNTSYTDVVLKNYNLSTNAMTNEITLLKDLSTLFDKNQIDKFNSEEKMTKLKVTTTINKLKNNKNKITIARVNVNNYTYNYNWWWFQSFMMQQMQMQQMMNMSRVQGFGPNDFTNEDYLFLDKKEKFQSLEFIVDSNFNIEKDTNSETEFKNIDKDELLEEFNKNKNIKNFTASILDDEIRYIYQDNKTKTIYINFRYNSQK